MATEVWGVIASIIMNPPFVGAGVSATTLVVAFGFAVSRPCLTLKVRTFLQLKLEGFRVPFLIYDFINNFFKKINQMMEDAIHFLSKDTVVQAMSRSANKVCLFVFVLLRYLT